MQPAAHAGLTARTSFGIQLRRVGSGERLTFGTGETVLSERMALHARVAWTITAQPWLLETGLIGRITLPLNLGQNTNGAFRRQLSQVRADQGSRARGP